MHLIGNHVNLGSFNVNKRYHLHPVFLAPILFCDHKVELFFCSLLALSESYMTEQALVKLINTRINALYKSI